jgi:hypothetical protein
LLIPDLEASHVHLQMRSTTIQHGPFHQQLVFIQDRAACVERFPCAWTTPRRSYAVMRQQTVLKLTPDAETKGFVVQHGGLSGVWVGEPTPDSPGLDA